MFCAAVVLHIPNFEVAVFSTGRRASQLLLDQVLRMIRRYKEINSMEEAGGRIIKCNQETVWMSGPGSDDIRKLSSFPGKAKTYGVYGLSFRFYVTNYWVGSTDISKSPCRSKLVSACSYRATRP